MIEEFIFGYLSSDVELIPFLKEGNLWRIHPTYSPSNIIGYPRVTYDVFSELETTYHKGAKQEFFANLSLDIWSKGNGAFGKARSVANIIRGEPPVIQKLHCFRGELGNVFIQSCLINDYSADDTKPPFDASSEPFYNIQFILDIYYNRL